MTKTTITETRSCGCSFTHTGTQVVRTYHVGREVAWCPGCEGREVTIMKVVER